ncbi:hypothetical protein ACQJBY_068695 [Aegilops geniculata]
MCLNFYFVHTVELMKQSSCSMQLANKTDHYVAFKFNKEPGKVVDECKLRVIYVPTSSPSPFSEDSEQGSSARSLENGTPNSTLPQSVFRSSGEASKDKSSEATSMISKLTEEKMSAVQQNQKLRQELDVLRKESSKSNGGFSITFLIVVGILGIIAGFILKKT